ncbi:MAG: excinuclease ABC subunit UvrA, partial [Lactiplantibacillus plantarum]|nr:excinuclease ABC subunit UvrA [Lactiplantibacillus plantarum]
MANNRIVIRGAREHNLKAVNLTIPKNKLVVVTGLSGSGKSSLAFDTLYAEGRRRYVQSLSSYARQFLGQMDKPAVDSIEGLNPAISIDQKTTSHNPRSTVGTVTEINDYLRLLWARVGRPICPNDGTVIERQSVDQMADRVMALPDRTKIQVLSPVIRAKRGEHKEVFKRVQQAGYVRVLVDGTMHEISDEFTLAKNKKHTIEIVVDRLIMKDSIRSRLFDSIEAALRLSGGYMKLDVVGQEPLNFSEFYACPLCGFTVGELEPRLFSFNAPFGACPDCSGLGMKLAVDVDLVVPDTSKSLRQGALAPWKTSKYYNSILKQACDALKIPLDKPFEQLTKAQRETILHGSKKPVHFHVSGDFGVNDTTVPFEGIIANINRRYQHPMSKFMRDVISKYMTELTCETCQGRRLNEKALAVKVAGQDIAAVSDLPIARALDFFKKLDFDPQRALIAKPILKEVRDRLSFLVSVGLDYLTLSRSANTLSGGEAQRIRLATQIGSNLSGVMYVLDEPSIGLHQRDNARLIKSLQQMRDLGNSLIVVEHDDETMRSADYLVDMGPGAGVYGGYVTAAGTPAEVMANPHSLTGQYLAGKKFVPVPLKRRRGNGHKITITGAQANNLKNLTVDFPLGKFVVVTGVSGSGKSTLVNRILKRALAQKLNHNSEKPGKYRTIKGYQTIEKIIDIDQSPIGRT